MVDTGAGDPVQVVCGAPNARAGMTGVFVPPGAYIPGKDMTLGIGKIRGVESRGMLVSEFELKLSDDHEGIIDLPADAPLGANYAQWAGLDDPGDRDQPDAEPCPTAPACTASRATSPPPTWASSRTRRSSRSRAVPCPVKVTLDFGATPSLCPAFALRLVRGVKNGPSPDWLQRRLKAIGLRPINALVDITNFITYDRGRPLHVFDAAKVHGNLTVRRARDGRDAAGARRQDLHARRHDLRDRRRERRRVARRHHRRRGVGLLGDDHRRADRSRRCGSRSTSRRPAASSASTPTRAIASSAASIRPSCCPASSLRRRMVLDLCGGDAVRGHGRGQGRSAERIIDFPLTELPRLAGLDRRLTEVHARARQPRLSRRRQGDSA